MWVCCVLGWFREKPVGLALAMVKLSSLSCVCCANTVSYRTVRPSHFFVFIFHTSVLIDRGGTCRREQTKPGFLLAKETRPRSPSPAGTHIVGAPSRSSRFLSIVFVKQQHSKILGKTASNADPCAVANAGSPNPHANVEKVVRGTAA